jgi:hypothetical protein
MADNYPLRVNPVSRRIEEYNVGDTVNLTGNNIVANNVAGTNGQYLKSNGSQVIWDLPGDVYLTATQTISNKTLTNTTIAGASNPGIVLTNANLQNSTITINGVPIALGGSVSSVDSNTTYTFNAADGTGNSKILRLTSAGTGAGVVQDITLVAGTNVNIQRSTNSLTFSATDTNTTYSAGNGLSLTSTVFALKNNAQFTADRLLKWNDVAKELTSSIVSDDGSLLTVNGDLDVTTTTTDNLKIVSSSFSLRNGNSLSDDTIIRMQFNRSTDSGGSPVSTAGIEWYGTGGYFRLNSTGNLAGTLVANRREIVTTSDSQTLLNKTLVAPDIGAALATSVNKLTITSPTTSSTLTIEDSKTLKASTSVYYDTTASTTTLSAEGDIAFQKINNTTLRIRMRGADGTTRFVDLTLA